MINNIKFQNNNKNKLKNKFIDLFKKNEKVYDIKVKVHLYIFFFKWYKKWYNYNLVFFSLKYKKNEYYYTW